MLIYNYMAILSDVWNLNIGVWLSLVAICMTAACGRKRERKSAPRSNRAPRSKRAHVWALQECCVAARSFQCKYFIFISFIRYFEVWLSLVERCVRDAEAAGSSPVTSTILSFHNASELWTLSFYVLLCIWADFLVCSFSFSVGFYALKVRNPLWHFQPYGRKDVCGLCGGTY